MEEIRVGFLPLYVLMYDEGNPAARVPREAYAEIGYTDEYARKWGRDNVCGASDLKITQIVDRQSPDISQGVDGGGWGDQGVFWGMAVADPSTNYMPRDCWLARQIGSLLYSRAKADGICGLDIKVLVALDDNLLQQLQIVKSCLFYRCLRHSIKIVIMP